MEGEKPGVIVLIVVFHLPESFLIVFGSVEIHVVTSRECLPVAGGGSIFFSAAGYKGCEKTQDCRRR